MTKVMGILCFVVYHYAVICLRHGTLQVSRTQE